MSARDTPHACAGPSLRNRDGRPPFGILSVVKRCMAGRDGTAAIEFAFLAPVFLLFLFGLLEIGLINWAYVVSNAAAESGSKYMIDTKSAYQAPSYGKLREAICGTFEAGGLSCNNLAVAVYAMDNPIANPVSIPAAIANNNPTFKGDNFIIALGYHWTLGLISTPLLVPEAGGMRQIKTIRYIATAERPIE